MSRKLVERETRQDFILSAARRLFAEKGIENSSMDDIAAASDYTRRTLYSYFRSRDEICLRVHMSDLAERWALQQEALRNVEGGLAQLLVWAETFFTYCVAHPSAMRMESYWDFHGIDPARIGEDSFREFSALNDDLADGLREIFRLGVEDGGLRPDLEQDLAISQFLYSLRAVVNRALSPAYSFADIDPEHYLRHWLDLLCRGITRNGE